MRLLVTMALPKKDITTVGDGKEGYIYERARIEILDWETKTSLEQHEYRPPPENLPDGLSVRFTGGCPYQGKWYQASGTEVVVYNVADWSVESVFSHPTFHDLHGVTVIDDQIVIPNTGLEMVQFLDMNGEIVREKNLASVPTWERFDRDTDYRAVGSTKPHEIHVNHVFQLDGQWWATRAMKDDAINLSHPDERIDIRVGHPHDGIIRGDFIYFTTTNAHIVIANVATRKVEDVIELAKLDRSTRGWCRGLEVDGDYAYVGFSRLRRSKWAGTFHSMKDVVKGRKRNTHIEKIDLRRKVLVDSYDYERDGSGAIFTLMDYDRVQGKLPG
jgi:hypothetical protein